MQEVQQHGPGQAKVHRHTGFVVRPFEPRDLPALHSLFAAYHQWLGLDLHFQHYAAEVDSLPGAYHPAQKGVLLLAIGDRRDAESDRTAGEEALGCVALRPLDHDRQQETAGWHAMMPRHSNACEMKRLYVTPEARGLGVGQALISAVLDQARRYGYASCLLDTLPRMQGAMHLYARLGFVQTNKYYDTPLDETIFMIKDLC